MKSPPPTHLRDSLSLLCDVIQFPVQCVGRGGKINRRSLRGGGDRGKFIKASTWEKEFSELKKYLQDGDRDLEIPIV